MGIERYSWHVSLIALPKAYLSAAHQMGNSTLF